jgi:hypothetical protein
MEQNKKAFKVYLSQADYNMLLQKAAELNIIGKGSLSHLLVKLANEPIIFMDSNLKKLAEVFKFTKK